jgi:hypothetical protein
LNVVINLKKKEEVLVDQQRENRTHRDVN